MTRKIFFVIFPNWKAHSHTCTSCHKNTNFKPYELITIMKNDNCFFLVSYMWVFFFFHLITYYSVRKGFTTIFVEWHNQFKNVLFSDIRFVIKLTSKLSQKNTHSKTKKKSFLCVLSFSTFRMIFQYEIQQSLCNANGTIQQRRIR